MESKSADPRVSWLDSLPKEERIVVDHVRAIRKRAMEMRGDDEVTERIFEFGSDLRAKYGAGNLQQYLLYCALSYATPPSGVLLKRDLPGPDSIETFVADVLIPMTEQKNQSSV